MDRDPHEARRERPLIAINGELSPGELPSLTLALRYAEALERAGAMPLVLPPLVSADFLADLLDRVDGLLLSGGADFDTERLGLEPTHPAAKPVPGPKQDFDFTLAHQALERRIPTLGVCYGMQLLALSSGAALHQHLPDDVPGSRDHTGGVEHAVRVEPGTKLAALLGVTSLAVVSRHHQAISRPGPGWTLSATDDEGLIEAIELADHPFAVGVQWHPELSPGTSRHAGLFTGLVRAASEHATKREPSRKNRSVAQGARA